MHWLDIPELSPSHIQDVFNLTDQLKQSRAEQSLQGKTFILFFPESSIRTRITFEKAIRDLGGDSILFPPAALDRREELLDTIKYIENWADAIIVRYSDFATVIEMSQHTHVPIINAMTALNHPCEIITDLYSIREQRSDYQELVYTFVGPESNISRSWRDVAKVMNLNFHHVNLPGQEITVPSPNYTFHTELDEILPHSDVILTDSLPDSCRTDAYISRYQITLARMETTRPGSMLNPCPPFYRGEEVSTDAINSDYFVGHAFKKNLLYAQQAILLYCLSNE